MPRSSAITSAATLVLLAAGALAGACGSVASIEGSGRAGSETRAVSGVDRVQVEGVGTLVVTQGDVESLTIHADDNLLRDLRSDVANGELQLGPRPRIGGISPRTPIEYDLTVKRLRSVHLEGAAEARSSHLDTDQLQLHVEGAGRTDLSGLTAQALTVHLQHGLPLRATRQQPSATATHARLHAV